MPFPDQGSVRRFVNFGGNQTWESRCYTPASEQEVIEILARHARETIRALGSLHSWSEIATDASVSLDLSRLNQVEPYTKDGGHFVRVGAGCTLQSLLDRVHRATDQTLPTLGAIKKQAIAGAVSTATHGSGRPSLSHFVRRLRVAAFDPATGKPRIFEYDGGDELEAARCGLGCMGIILSVDLATVPKYQVTEVVRAYQNVAEMLALYDGWPLTQFIFMPHRWRGLVYQRKREDGAVAGSSALKRAFFRLYERVSTDIMFHLGVISTRWLGSAWVKAFLGTVPFFILKNVERTDDAEPVLTLAHYYFRHEEMEVFVPQSKLAQAFEVVRAVVNAFADSNEPMPAKVADSLRSIGLLAQVDGHRGSFCFHYPIFFRRVMPEDGLIAMGSSAAEPYFTISFFTFDPPAQRAPFYALCSLLARALNQLFGARLHWGKHFPLQFADVAPLYPGMEKFRTLCARTDPNGVFRNAYTARVLNLPIGAQNRGARETSLAEAKEGS